jgi:hypothetical protein
MTRPLAIDLFCGLGGWTDGLLEEGYDVVGFDIERHRYPERALPMSDDGTKIQTAGVDFNNPNVGSSKNRSFNYANECLVRDAPLTGGWIEYPAQLVIQDVLTLHGSQFRDAALIVASPPCQGYSYRAMPWKRAKALPPPCNALFDACFRIQREASEAAGRHIPLVVENVRGAQKWVGRARWNYGSFYLWGDVPALMPMTLRRKLPVAPTTHRGDGSTLANIEVGDGVKGAHGTSGSHWTNPAERHTKNNGGSWFNVAHNTTSGKGQNPDGRKQPGIKLSEVGFNVANARQFGPMFDGANYRRTEDDKRQHIGIARKAASAMIAKIPLPLSRHIAAVYARRPHR